MKEITIPSGVTKDLHQQLLEGAQALVQQVELMEIATTQEADFAGTLLTVIDEKIALVHSILDPMVNEPYRSYKANYDYRARFLNDYENSRTIIRKKISEHLAKVRREAEIQHAKAQKVLEKKGLPTTELVMQAPKLSSVSTRKAYSWELVDEKLVPDEYWILDEAKLGRLVRSLGKDLKIPGIRILETDVPVNNRR